MSFLKLELKYMVDANERNKKILIYSLLEDFVDYCGFVFNGVAWFFHHGMYKAKPNWIESEAGFLGEEREVLKRARETCSQAIRTNVVLDDEIKTAIVEAHSYDFLRRNPKVLRSEERLWLDRRI